MRGRMTLQFVMLLVPFLLGTSYMVVMLTTKASEDKIQQNLGELKDRALRVMKDPDWQESLERLASEPAFRQLQAGIIVRDRDDQAVFRSYVNRPPIEVTPQMREKYRFAGGRVKQYRLGVLMPRKPMDTTLPEMLFGLSVIVIGAVAGGAWFMVGKVLSPISSLAQQTSEASADHLSVRLESPSKDAEMRELVETLNGLLDRVYETAEIKGRFYAAASHELRTPLQALSGHLELASSRKRTSEEYEEVVKESYKQTRRLISLVQGLLFLHQVDTHTHSSQVPVNLSESCESALEMMYSLAVSRGLKVSDSFEPNINIQAVPSHAEVLARNLIENAVKYATEGGELSVHLRTDHGQILLEVTNDFPDNVKIATENVFEAFYRDDTSRNSKTGGNGLGLAICRAVATANGWDVRLQQESGKIHAIVNFGSLETPKESKERRKVATKVSKPATA